MSEGIIVSNLGSAKYRVRLVYDHTGWQAQWDRSVIADADADALKIVTIEAWIKTDDAWKTAKSQLDLAIANGFNLDTYVWDVNQTNITNRKARIAYDRAIAAKVDVFTTQRWLASQKKPDTYELDVWCADYDDTLEVGLHVGMLEINNENPEKKEYFIHPNKTKVATIGGSAYDYARDGSMVGAVSSDNPVSWAINHVLFIGWQRFQPLYRLATVVSVTDNVCDISLDGAFSSHEPEGRQIGINGAAGSADALARTNVPIWYMDNGGTLEVGARVVVLYEGQDINRPRAIGVASDTDSPPPDWGIITTASGAFAFFDHCTPFKGEGVSSANGGRDTVTSYSRSDGVVYVVSGASTAVVTVTAYELLSSGYRASTPLVINLEPGFEHQPLSAFFVKPGGLVSDRSFTVNLVKGFGVVDPILTEAAADILVTSVLPPTLGWYKVGPDKYERVTVSETIIPERVGQGPSNEFGDFVAFSEVHQQHHLEVVSGGVFTTTKLGADYYVADAYFTTTQYVGQTGWFWERHSWQDTILQPATDQWNAGDPTATQKMLDISVPRHPLGGMSRPFSYEGFSGVSADTTVYLGEARPAVWVHEPSLTGDFVTTQGPFGCASMVRTSLSGLSFRDVEGPRFVFEGDNNFRRTYLGHTFETITAEEVWRILGRAPLADSALPNPYP